MSVWHGDPREFQGCTCGHATHVGDFPPPCRCFRPALGPPVRTRAAVVIGPPLLFTGTITLDDEEDTQ